MIIPFELSHEFSPGSTPEENTFALKVLLEALIALDVGYLRNHPNVPPLYAANIIYERTRNWMTMDVMLQTGYGDCKSLAAALIAERIVRNRIRCTPVFRDIQRSDGMRDFHILVESSPGKYEDPSKVCGMADYQLLNMTGRE